MREDKNNVLVVGTGTIGEPLIALLSRMKKSMGIDEVIFQKRTPLVHERPKVNSLVKMGAKLSVEEDCVEDFEKLGHTPNYTFQEAISKAKVIVDCTPAGNLNKKNIYEKYSQKTFIAQGSEKGFGVPYALGVNDNALGDKEEKYIQVVSCNTHAIARILTCLSRGLVPRVIYGDFVCLRRSNDVSQDGGFVPSVACGKHDDDYFGTHHARDVNDLFDYKYSLPIFSSAVKTNTQYMHTVRFSVTLDEEVDREEIFKRLEADKYVALTKKKTTNKVFSYGRDHGFYGRIYSQTVICEPTLFAKSYGDASRVTGFAYTPQDGNSLMSSVSSVLYGLYGSDYSAYLSNLDELLVNEV